MINQDSDTDGQVVASQTIILYIKKNLMPVSYTHLLGTDIFSPSEIVHGSTAYSDVWILVRSDNTKTHHRQQFGVERHYLVVDSASNAVIIRPKTKFSAHQ